MDDESALINEFLDMCAESLDPDSMYAVSLAVWRLCEARHIHAELIRPWGITAPSAS
jgi:hypothetical protein